MPMSIVRACRVGWDIGGLVVHSTKGWRLLRVYSVSERERCREAGRASPAVDPIDANPIDQGVIHPPRFSMARQIGQESWGGIGLFETRPSDWDGRSTLTCQEWPLPDAYHSSHPR